MLAMLMLLYATAHGCVGPTTAELTLANKVQAAVEDLDALSLGVEIRENRSKLGRRPAVKRTVHLKILMADGGRFRVEALQGDAPFAAIVCDGKKITEWDAKENLWTRYEASPLHVENAFKELLVKDYLVTDYAKSWVDAEGPFGQWFERVIMAPETKLTGTEIIDERSCDVVTYKKTEWEFPASVTETFTFYIDRRTHLLVKQNQTVVGGVPLIASMNSRKDFFYRDVRTNPTLPDDAFVFTPPRGSKFISSDAPRFKIPTLDGKPAPNPKLPSVNGSTVSLQDYKDKKAVLLVFWATWCGPCKKEMPTLIKLHEEFATKGLAIIGVSTDKDMGSVKWFLKRHPLPYTILHDTKRKVGDLYFVKAIPRTFLIDKEGIVVKSWLGWSGKEEEAEIRKELAKLLR